MPKNKVSIKKFKRYFREWNNSTGSIQHSANAG